MTVEDIRDGYYHWLVQKVTNKDSYSRNIYMLNSNNIRSGSGVLAHTMAGETVRWIAAVV